MCETSQAIVLSSKKKGIPFFSVRSFGWTLIKKNTQILSINIKISIQILSNGKIVTVPMRLDIQNKYQNKHQKKLLNILALSNCDLILSQMTTHELTLLQKCYIKKLYSFIQPV